MTATEENLVLYLREHYDFRKCVKFLEEYINQTKSLQRTLSEPDLSRRCGSDRSLNIDSETIPVHAFG